MSYISAGGVIKTSVGNASGYSTSSIGQKGPTGPTGSIGRTGLAGKVGPTGPVGPVLSIGFDGGNSSSIYSSGPVFDCGRAE